MLFPHTKLLWLPMCSCQFVHLYIKTQIILSPISLLLSFFLCTLFSSMTEHISFICITITGGISSSTRKLITVSSAFLCHHIIYNTKFAPSIQKAIYHKVNSLAYGRNYIVYNAIIQTYCQRELSMAQNQKVKG